MNGKQLLKTARPILFNTDMVRAILDGKKTETRRVMEPQPWNIGQGENECRHEEGFFNIGEDEWACCQCGCGIIPLKGGSYFRAPYQTGGILYVRETWQYLYELDGNEQIIEGTGRYYYAATDQIPFDTYIDPQGISHEKTPWKPSIHMPKKAARIFLKVTNIRPERLQDIDDDGVVAEGLQIGDPFDDLWNSTVKKSDQDRYGWEANPWVWVIGFKKINARSDNE